MRGCAKCSVEVRDGALAMTSSRLLGWKAAAGTGTVRLSCTTSVQLKITNPRGGGRIHAKTANYGLVVVYMDRA